MIRFYWHFFSKKKGNINTMKRILTILLATGAFVAAHAQKNDGRDVVLGRGNTGSYPTYPNYPGNYPNTYPNNYPNSSSGAQTDAVNREYDAKIQSIRNNPYLSYDEKDRSIRQLERDRQRKIQQINSSYNNGSYNGNNGCENNGKHNGWNKKNKNKNWKKGDRDWDDN